MALFMFIHYKLSQFELSDANELAAVYEIHMLLYVILNNVGQSQLILQELLVNK